MELRLLYFDDCPNWKTTNRILEELGPEYGFEHTLELVDTDEKAIELGFRGSPTVLIDGIDPFDDPRAPFGLSCRIYRTSEGFRGSPTEQMLREALEHHRSPAR